MSMHFVLGLIWGFHSLANLYLLPDLQYIISSPLDKLVPPCGFERYLQTNIFGIQRHSLTMYKPLESDLDRDVWIR